MKDRKRVPPELLEQPERKLSPDELAQEMDRFFAHLEDEFKEIPEATKKIAAQRVVDFLQGRSTWADIFNIPPETIQRIAEFGFMQYQAGRYAEAERFFKVLTMLQWNNGFYHAMLATVYHRQRRPGEAIVQFGQAIEMHPDDGLSLTGRAEIYLEYGWLTEARADIDRALAVAGTEDTPWHKRALVLRKRLVQLEGKRAATAVPSGAKGRKGN